MTLKSSGWHGSLSTGRYGKNLNAWKWTIGYVRKPVSPAITDSLAVTTSLQPRMAEQFTVGYGWEFVLLQSVFRTFLVRGQVQPFVGYESVSRFSQTVLADSTVLTRSSLLLAARCRFWAGDRISAGCSGPPPTLDPNFGCRTVGYVVLCRGTDMSKKL